MQKAQGALVAQVTDGSPAMKAHIKAGDVILAINGQPITGSADLVHKIGTFAPGADLNLKILRDGTQRTLRVTLGTAPGKQEVAELGLSLAPASSVAGAGGSGVVVTDVNPDSAAAEQGFQTGDVILEVDGKAVSTPAERQQGYQRLSRVWQTQRAPARPVGRPDGVRRAPRRQGLSLDSARALRQLKSDSLPK